MVDSAWENNGQCHINELNYKKQINIYTAHTPTITITMIILEIKESWQQIHINYQQINMYIYLQYTQTSVLNLPEPDHVEVMYELPLGNLSTHLVIPTGHCLKLVSGNVQILCHLKGRKDWFNATYN